MLPTPDRSHLVTPGLYLGAILTLGLLLLTLAVLPAAAADEPAVPTAVNTTGVVAVEEMFDFGALVKGDSAAHTFILQNPTDTPVTIDRVFPSCGCTVADFDRVVPAGGEGKVRVELDTMAVTGEGISKLAVYLNKATDPSIILALEYKVEPMLLAFPGYARWIYVQREQEGTIVQTVYSADGAEFDVVGVESPMPAIAVSFREATAEERRPKVEGSQWIVIATLDSAAPVGAITGFLDVHTTHPRQKLAQIPVSGFVRPTIFIEPAKGDFGTLSLDAPRTMVYQVRNFATEPIELTGVRTDVAGITAHIEPIENGRLYRVVLQLDPARMDEGPFNGTLEMKTDSAKIPRVTVDLTGTLVRRAAGG